MEGSIHFQALVLESKFQKACKHVVVLQNLVEDIKVRYKRASDNCLRSHCYALTLRLTTVESMLNLYKNYIAEKAEEIEALMDKLEEAEPEPLILYDSDSEWD